MAAPARPARTFTTDELLAMLGQHAASTEPASTTTTTTTATTPSTQPANAFAAATAPVTQQLPPTLQAIGSAANSILPGISPVGQTPPAASGTAGRNLGQFALPLAIQLAMRSHFPTQGITSVLARAALGVLGRLGGTAADEAVAGRPLSPELAASEAGQAMLSEGVAGAATPLARSLVRGGRALVGPQSLTEGLPAAAAKAKIPLSAPELFPAEPSVQRAAEIAARSPTSRRRFMESGLESAQAVTNNVPQQLAEPVSGVSGRFARKTIGGLYANPIEGAADASKQVQSFLSSIPDAQRSTVAGDIYQRYGIRYDLNGQQMLDAIRTRPDAVVELTERLGTASGRPAPAVMNALTRVRQVWLSDSIDNAVRTGPAVGKLGSTFRGGIIDGNALAESFYSLSQAQRQRLFGPLLPDYESLMGVLSQNRLGNATVEALAPIQTRNAPQPGAIAWQPYAVALGAITSENAGTAGVAGRMTFGLTTATVTGIPRLLGRLLTSPAGIRWFAAGIDGQRRGLTNDVLVPYLTRLGVQLGLPAALTGGQQATEVPAESIASTSTAATR